MSFEDCAAEPDTNAVREAAGAEIYRFPQSRIARPQPGHRGDQVTVTHRGEVTVYASPEAMFAAIRKHDPLAILKVEELDEMRLAAEGCLREAQQVMASATEEASAIIARANARLRDANRRADRIGRGIVVAILAVGALILLGVL